MFCEDFKENIFSWLFSIISDTNTFSPTDVPHIDIQSSLQLG